MNETQQLETLWQILESRDRVVVNANQECHRLKEQIKAIHRQNCHVQSDNDKLRDELQLHVKLIKELREEIRQLTIQLQLSQTAQKSLEQIIEQRDLTIEDIRETLHRSEENRLFLLTKIDKLQENLNESQATIEGMESSKFWKFREFVVKIKSSLNFKKDN
jgi:chromosome segregation ATPase